MQFVRQTPKAILAVAAAQTGIGTGAILRLLRGAVGSWGVWSTVVDVAMMFAITSVSSVATMFGGQTTVEGSALFSLCAMNASGLSRAVAVYGKRVSMWLEENIVSPKRQES